MLCFGGMLWKKYCWSGKLFQRLLMARHPGNVFCFGMSMESLRRVYVLDTLLSKVQVLRFFIFLLNRTSVNTGSWLNFSFFFPSCHFCNVKVTYILIPSSFCSLRILLPVQKSLRPRTTEPPFHPHATPPAETELFIPATAARLWPGLSVLNLPGFSVIRFKLKCFVVCTKKNILQA